MSTTGLAVRFIGCDRLPPIARRMASAYRLTGGLQTIGALFWLLVAVTLCAAMFANGIVLDSTRDIGAGAGSLLLDVAWLVYLFARRDRRRKASAAAD